MAEFPAMPLWTDAYLADTRLLSTVEHGAYLLLLMAAWRRPNCDLPDDDKILSRLAGLDLGEWLIIKPTIAEFWKIDRRRKVWTQKRLTSERDYVRKKSKSQADKAAKRWKDGKKTDAAAMPEECRGNAPTPTPTPTPTPIIDSPPDGGVSNSVELNGHNAHELIDQGEQVEPAAKTDQPKPDHFVEVWNELATRIGRPTVARLTDARRQVLKARLANHPVEDFLTVFEKVERSDFLAGRTPRWSGVTFDWITKQANFIKVLEGNYD